MRTNFRVVLDLRHKGDLGNIFIGSMEWTEEEAMGECNDMLAQIVRHVDAVSHRNRPRIEWDEETDND